MAFSVCNLFCYAWFANQLMSFFNWTFSLERLAVSLWSLALRAPFASLSSSNLRRRLSKLFINDSLACSLSRDLAISTSRPSFKHLSSFVWCFSELRSSIAFEYCFWSCLYVVSVSCLCDSTDLIDLNWSWDANALSSSRSLLTFSRAISLDSSYFFISIKLFCDLESVYSWCRYSIFSYWSSLFKSTNSLLNTY